MGHTVDQDSTNSAHHDKHGCNMYTKRFLCAHKSIKTPLSSTPMLFKVLSYINV